MRNSNRRHATVRSAFIGAAALLAGCTPRPAPSNSPPPVSVAPLASSRAKMAASGAPFENHGGMWMPSQVPARAEELRRLGLDIDPALLSDPKSSLLASIVQLNGCSASFVSKDGLVVTNHHCATGALQRNSTPAQDLLKAGMLAKSRAEERSGGPEARLSVLSKMTEVTTELRAALATAAGDLARQLALEKFQNQAIGNCEKGRADVRCGLVSMYAGLRFFTIETLELRDIRIVYAPAESIGDFGGEVDNWRWPRHCGDVAFFRAYVGKNGLPADYSPDNVPYQPTAFLKLATAPLEAGDLVFVAGYPGRTELLAPAVEMRETERTVYPEQLRMFEAYLALMTELSKKDPELAIKATSRMRSFDNYRIKNTGELEGMKRGHLLDEKVAEERALQAFINADPERVAKYGTVIADLEHAFAEREETRAADAALGGEFLMPRLLFAAYRIARMADERQKPDADRDPEYQERNVSKIRDEFKGLPSSYDPKLDRALLKLALQRDRARDPQHRTPALAVIVGTDTTDARLDVAIAALYEKTRLADEKFRVELFESARFGALGQSPDPIVRLIAKLYPGFRAAIERRKRFQGKLLELGPRYSEARLAFKGGQVAPDANSTLRIAYGTVKKAPAGDPGADLGAFTSLSQLVAKNTGKEPFDAPSKLLAAAKYAAHSRYYDPKLGDVPVDFLSDLHITNGNSGSATLNARGELVGLAFDGTYESVASDWAFKPNTRSIHVDLRYILFLLSSVDPAPGLLSELGVAP
ncbi:MAG: S46 family peptidase [Polyangiaceae bacterium]